MDEKTGRLKSLPVYISGRKIIHPGPEMCFFGKYSV